MPKFVTVAMEPPCGVRREAALAGEFDEFVVARHQFAQRRLVRLAQAPARARRPRLRPRSRRRWRSDARSCCRPAGRRARCFRRAQSPARARRKARDRVSDRWSCDARASGRGARAAPTVASGRVQLRRIASATATRMSKPGSACCSSRLAMNFSKSSIVTRPAAPLPAMPARSAACRPSSFMRAFIRGDI